MYSLGRNVFVTVQRRDGKAKVYIRQYARPADVKGGRLKPTRKLPTLDKEQFQRLLKKMEGIQTELQRLQYCINRENEKKPQDKDTQTDKDLLQRETTTTPHVFSSLPPFYRDTYNP